jgi:hypothetical protein
MRLAAAAGCVAHMRCCCLLIARWLRLQVSVGTVLFVGVVLCGCLMCVFAGCWQTSAVMDAGGHVPENVTTICTLHVALVQLRLGNHCLLLISMYQQQHAGSCAS